jgi:hypothetical protein
MIQFLQYLALAWYFLVGVALWRNWQYYLLKDMTMVPSQRQCSRIAMLLAVLLWPLALPWTYLELLNRQPESLLARKRFEPEASMWSLFK